LNFPNNGKPAKFGSDTDFVSVGRPRRFQKKSKTIAKKNSAALFLWYAPKKFKSSSQESVSGRTKEISKGESPFPAVAAA
jgi:hypothetical protein